MKYGESDFFKYLKLNDLFFTEDHNKIIELQARREYEGFGEYPSFTGWDYEEYKNRLINLKKFCGIQVWCQTGGWSDFRNFTFLKKTSIWNELNTFVTLKIFKEDMSVEKAIAEFYKKNNTDKFIKFLKLSNFIIENLLYDPVYSKQKLYFNRLRVPSLLNIFWDNVTLSDFIITFYNHFNMYKKESLKSAHIALMNFKKIKKLRNELGLRYDYDFH